MKWKPHSPFLTTSQKERGRIKLIVARPREDERKVIESAEINTEEGLVGDCWKDKASSSAPNGKAHPGKQITIMNSRSIEVLSGEMENWPLAGDQIFADLDLSLDNLPAGTQLVINEAILEVTEFPHTGCHKFRQRFGLDALKFVKSKVGRTNKFRGINCKVLKGGVIKTGDEIRKISA